MSYSQRDEEAIILENLPETGRFLDVGAFDFKVFSNTRALAEKGWGGVLVEASPEVMPGLIKNAAGFNVSIVNALVVAVKPNDNLMRFYSSPDAIGTSEKTNHDKWKNATKFTEMWMPTTTLKLLCETFIHQSGKFEFINLDTEGSSAALLGVITSWMPDEWLPSLICVEFDNQENEIRLCLESRGYEVIHKTAENLIAKRK